MSRDCCQSRDVPAALLERVELLRHSNVLSGIEDCLLADLAAKVAVVELGPGEALFRKGDPPDAMYIVAKGRIRIHDGDYLFTELEPPSSLGEYALVRDAPRTASATARGSATLLRLDRDTFHRQLSDDAGFLHGLLRSMLARIVEKDVTEEEISRNREEIRRQRDQIASQRDELERQRQQLAQMNAVKDKFFALVAHDLKNPLMALSLMSKALSDRPEFLTPQKTQEYAQLTHESATLACQLMENLLDWSRSQSNGIRFVAQPVSLHGSVRDNFALLGLCARNKRIALRNEVPVDLTVLADPRSISTIVRNLVSNALKYTPPGGQVTVRATGTPSEVLWSVSDTGVGIEPDRLADLFRGDVYATTRGTADEMGTGLGLKLCKEFAERNRGAIRVTSEQGKGTTFTVTLPRA
jgi:two-component system sensor histidine kinase/response regulator